MDYPVFGSRLAARVGRGEAERGILLCGTGIGMSIVANKVPGVRAALVHDVYSARMAREHNDANVLVIGGRTTGKGLAREIVRTWLDARFEGGRHERRLRKIEEIEQAGREAGACPAVAGADPEVWEAIHGEILREEEGIVLIASENYVFRSRAGGAGVGLHQQVRGRLSGRSATTAAAGSPIGWRSWRSPGQGPVRGRARQRAAVSGSVGQHGGLLRTARSRATPSSAWPWPTAATSPTGLPVSFSGRLLPGGDLRRGSRDRLHRLRRGARRSPGARSPGPSSPARVPTPAPGLSPLPGRIADEVGAYLIVDMAHIAGLVAGGAAPQPGALRRRGHHHHPQDAARSPGRPGPVPGRDTAGPSTRPSSRACREGR